jgi:tetratricopeptide (TPR) repeat protein
MKILYGLALAEHNFDNDAKALNIYKEIIEKWPKFDKPYQMVAFIYLRQNDYKQAGNYASLCLDRSHGNIFALYIQAVTKMDNC